MNHGHVHLEISIPAFAQDWKGGFPYGFVANAVYCSERSSPRFHLHPNQAHASYDKLSLVGLHTCLLALAGFHSLVPNVLFFFFLLENQYWKSAEVRR